MFSLLNFSKSHVLIRFICSLLFQFTGTLDLVGILSLMLMPSLFLGDSPCLISIDLKSQHWISNIKHTDSESTSLNNIPPRITKAIHQAYRQYSFSWILVTGTSRCITDNLYHLSQVPASIVNSEITLEATLHCWWHATPWLQSSKSGIALCNHQPPLGGSSVSSKARVSLTVRSLLLKDVLCVSIHLFSLCWILLTVARVSKWMTTLLYACQSLTPKVLL